MVEGPSRNSENQNTGLHEPLLIVAQSDNQTTQLQQNVPAYSSSSQSPIVSIESEQQKYKVQVKVSRPTPIDLEVNLGQARTRLEQLCAEENAANWSLVLLSIQTIQTFTFMLTLMCLSTCMHKTHVATGFLVYFISRYCGYRISRRTLRQIEPKITTGLNDVDFASEEGNLQLRILGRNSREHSKLSSQFYIGSMLMGLSSLVIFVTETDQGSPVQEAHVVVFRMVGLLLLALCGSFTQYACDVYIENCPHESIKQKHTHYQKIVVTGALVAAPLASTVILRHEGAFPLTIFLLSLTGIALAYQFKETSQDDRREALRMTQSLKPDIRQQIQSYTLLTNLDWQLAKVQLPSNFDLELIRSCLLLAYYIFGVAIAVADQIDDKKTWVGLLFSIGILSATLGNFYPNLQQKVAGGFALAFVSSILLLGGQSVAIGALIFCVSGYGLASDSLLELLSLISRRPFEHWDFIWSTQNLGIGAGAVWGTMSVNKLHMVTAMLPYQVALIVVAFYSYQHFRTVKQHNRFVLGSQEETLRQNLLESSYNPLNSLDSEDLAQASPICIVTDPVRLQTLRQTLAINVPKRSN